MRVQCLFIMAALVGCGGGTSSGDTGGHHGGTTATLTLTGGDGGSMASGGAGGMAGGDAGSTMTGGTGGATGGSTMTGGTGGTGGCVAEPYVCDPKDCGLVANECGFYTNCDTGIGQDGLPITCKSELGGIDSNGPMTCNHDTHRCECVPGSPEAQAMCGGANTLPSVQDWCTAHGGCIAAYCGDPSVPKIPDSCTGSGQFQADGARVWCCAKPCAVAADCDDANECTTNACGADHVCAFGNSPQVPCNGGAGVCIDGQCLAL